LKINVLIKYTIGFNWNTANLAANTLEHMPIVSSSISPVYTGDIVQILNDQAMQTIVL